MPTMQIRNVPERTSRELKSRAAAAGLSLSDYLLRELNRLVERPSIEELAQRIARDPREALPSAADVLAEARAGR